MSSAAYSERYALFGGMQNDLRFVLGHKELQTPDHPYVDVLRTLSDYAMFGVIDTANELLHVEGQLIRDSVVVVPVLHKDMRLGTVTVTSRLLKNENQEENFDFFDLHTAAGTCDASEHIRAPIIAAAPYINERSRLVRGLVMAHELDHAYWWLRRKTRFKGYDHTTTEGITAQEISANRLEQQILFAHEPELYDELYGNISLQYASKDFEKPFKQRDRDKTRKSIRAVAFVNFMLDSLGADVGVRPTSDVVAAFRAQALV